MDGTIAKLLGEGTLPEEMVQSLQEAFDARVKKVREEAEIAVREEYAARYENDKSTLVEAMDRMITDAVEKQATEVLSEKKKFAEARKAFRESKKKMQEAYKARLSEQTEAARKFVSERTAGEVKKLREAKETILVDRLKVAEALEVEKKRLAEQQAARVKKIDEFITRQVAKELKELTEDHRALVETRMKLVTEGRKRLGETQKRFVKESAKRVEQAINATMKREMSQLHEDLERNRQNLFGRRIFEAVAAEYLTSYLAEGTEIRNLQKVIEAKEQEVTATKQKLDEAAKAGEIAARKARVAEERATRTKIMSELLTNLRGEKRQVMEGMLEHTKTDALRETFQRLLPVVLSEAPRKAPTAASAAAPRRPLHEVNRERTSTVVTGDHRVNRLHEAVNAESEFDTEVAQVVRLAGIVSK